jgi:putative transposase
VIALRSNIRWYSDHSSSLAAMAQWRAPPRLVRHRRLRSGVIAWSATTAGISGEMVRDLMIVCVERRFETSKAPHLVEWLSDNCSAYNRQGHIRHSYGLRSAALLTPVRSPQYNGIAEAFVKTFKRDYARLSILPDAATVIALLPAWFEDYNEVHPHSGLKFLSPREFLRFSA